MKDVRPAVKTGLTVTLWSSRLDLNQEISRLSAGRSNQVELRDVGAATRTRTEEPPLYERGALPTEL